MKRLIVIAALAVSPVMAQQPDIPDEATKAWALKRAYELNGNRMVGFGSIDLTEEVRQHKLQEPHKIQTEKIKPMPKDVKKLN